MTFLDAFRLASVAGWCICLGCFAPAIGRLLRGRGRLHDPIWGLMFLLAANRLLFLSRASPEAAQSMAAVLALVTAYFAVWYQRYDA